MPRVFTRKFFGQLKYFVAIFFLLISPFSPNLAFAESAEDLREFGQSNIGFYRRDPCLNVSHTADTNGNDAYIIGDSLTVLSQNDIKTALPGAIIDAQSDISFANSQPNLESGVDRLKKLSDSDLGSKKILVFALGTSGGVSQADLDALFIALEGKDLKLILMTLYSGSDPNQVSSANALLKSTAEKTDNVSLMDWNAAAAENPGNYIDADGVRPKSPAGTEKFAETMKSAVDAVSTINIEANVGSGDFSNIKSAQNAEKSFFNGGPSELSAHWSDTDTASMKRLLENYGDLAYQLGQAVGVPYISVLVQMRYEDPQSKCGKNNFWGNGCPPGTKTGNAKKQGANLGEGFVQYAETLTNGMHDQALGITDPKEYLKKIGPTWVQGDVNGAGYSEISSMLKSVDALQKFVDSPEGQEIVQNFGNFSGSISGAQCCVSGASSPLTKASDVSWQDGWIVSGLDGFSKLPVSGDQNLGADFITTSPKGSTLGPNKITLHAFEGIDPGDGSMIKTVYESTGFPPHFTIDLKNKKLYQHASINKASSAVKDPDGDAAKFGDRSAGVQIEILGYDNTSEMHSEYQSWYLASDKNFPASAWDYLAKLLAAISAETGIPLTSTVNWSGTDRSLRLENQAFADYQGILSHKHAPLPNDHTDLENAEIWNFIKSALSSVNSEQNLCGLSSSGDISSFQEAVLKFAWPDYKGVGFTTMMPEYQAAVQRTLASGGYVGAGGIDCGGFVTVLMRESGWDPDYNSGNGPTGSQISYLESSSAWRDVTSEINSNKDALPGDVLIYDGHTLVFVGDIPGFNSKMASASLRERAPMADSVEDISWYKLSSGHPYKFFRKVN